MKILCTGDLHLGRRSSRLPGHLTGAAGRTHSSASCWDRIVELAIEESVDAVVMSGDIVDHANRYYEAIGPLEAGLRRLAKNGITTVAVAGNHDHDVLPRLADSLAGTHTGEGISPGSDPQSGSGQIGAGALHLLGRGGTWERITIRRGEKVLHIDGWSFPRQHIHESPIASYDLPVPDDAPVLGLLHADLEQPGSPYAPVTLPELRAKDHIDFWLLGHIHIPYMNDDAGQPPVLYPGSPQALDPGETGAHGVWLLELGVGRRFERRFIPLSSVRYDEVTIDLTDTADLDEVDARIIEGLQAHLASIENYHALRCVSCRLRVVGRTPVHHEIGAHLTGLITDYEPAVGEGAIGVVERVTVETRPAHDLAELARGRDPVGVLAGLILQLEEGPPRTGRLGSDLDRLLQSASRAAHDVARAPAYAGLTESKEDARSTATRNPAEPDSTRTPANHGDHMDDVVYRALTEQATHLLDLLLAQKEEG